MIDVRASMKRTVLLTAAAAFLFATNVSAQSSRAIEVGKKLKCMCGSCEMSAGGCSHPGGAFSGPCDMAKSMLKEADQHIAKGETDEQIIQSFVKEYGSIVYLEPPKHGFGLVAWAMPVVYLAFGALLVVFVISRWRKRTTPAMPNSAAAPGVSPELLERVRQQSAQEMDE